MRLITKFELASKDKQALRRLHKEVFNALVKTDPRTIERVNALASLENIEVEIALREIFP